MYYEIVTKHLIRTMHGPIHFPCRIICGHKHKTYKDAKECLKRWTKEMHRKYGRSVILIIREHVEFGFCTEVCKKIDAPQGEIKMIDIKKPIQIKIELNERRDGLCDFFYSETVKKEDKAIFEKTVKFLSEIPDAPIPEISNDGKTFTIKREGIEREEAFDMIAGEFILNCNLGKVTIAELFTVAAMGLRVEEKK